VFLSKSYCKVTVNKKTSYAEGFKLLKSRLFVLYEKQKRTIIACGFSTLSYSLRKLTFIILMIQQVKLIAINKTFLIYKPLLGNYN
jgi:hypothetical protein